MSTLLQADPPVAVPESAAQLDALLHHTGIAPLPGLGWLRVTGEDRVRWLNGMVTNSVTDLAPGTGCYTFILSAQGRIQGTAYAFAQPDSILLQTGRDHLPTLLATLDRFIIMDDVELTDISNTRSGLAVIGPNAAATLLTLGFTPPPTGPLAIAATTWQAAEVTMIAASSPLVPRFELWADPATTHALVLALTEAGTLPCSSEALEHLRLLEGTPRYGTDIRDRELPQETNQPHALHFSKGCYLGQEIVERIRSRGSVHRTFSAFRLTGPLPPPGTPIESEGKAVGELTSTGSIPLGSGPLQTGLGYIRREALDRAATLTCAGATAVPTPLPIRPA